MSSMLVKSLSMPSTSPLVLSTLLAVCLSGLATGQTESPMTLSQYIDSLHWDPAKSGPLIAVDAKNLTINDEGPNDLSGFERKMEKAGNLTVLAQSWAISLDEADLPNAYQALSNDDKLTYLLATLSASDIKGLTTTGISASELTGEPKAALLSLVPKPLTYLEGEATGTGACSQSEPVTLPEDQSDHVRLQLRKGVQVWYGATKMPNGGTSTSGISSLSFRGPAGTPIVYSTAGFRLRGSPEIVGKIVDSTEKVSDLKWSDPRLAKEIELKAEEPIADIVQRIRTATEVEVYSDARIATRTLNSYGSGASARDLLRGLALAVGGVFRRVGPAYVLTANLEGGATLEARLRVRKTLAQSEIQWKISEWRAVVAKRSLLESLPFSRDDGFQASSIPAADLASKNSDASANWVPLSQLPSIIQSAINDSQAKRQQARSAAPNRPFRDQGIPIPELQGQVRISPELGYRFILPDGRPLESQSFRPVTEVSTGSYSGRGSNPPGFPVDPDLFKLGSAVGIKSEDPRSVTQLCDTLKGFKVGEVWLDSTSPPAIQAAIDTGLVIDLIIHPWDVLKGEACPDPDRNILGMTGTEVNEIPGLRFDPIRQLTFTYSNSFSPADSELPRHWNRLLSLIPQKGIRRVILLDAEPAGYQAPAGNEFRGVGQFRRNGVLIQPGLPSQAPELLEFGYATALRRLFLRKHQIDPIDLKPANSAQVGPPAPFFDEPPFGPRRFGTYAKIHFPQRQERRDQAINGDWEALRYSLLNDQLNGLMEKLSQVCSEVLIQSPGSRSRPQISSLRSVTTSRRGVDPGADKRFTSYLSLNPQNSEDEQGNWVNDISLPRDQPFCIDLRDIPAGRFSYYLRHIFKAISK